MTIHQLRATVEAAALAAALRRLERCASNDRNTLPILSGVLIESDGPAGLLRLSCTDLDRQAVVTVPAVIEGGGKSVPILAPLAAILAKMPKGAQVELTGDDREGAGAKLACIMPHGGTFRASLAGFTADAFPVIKERAAAWSIEMRAGPLLAMLASAAKDAKPPNAGDSKGARFSFAADGLTVTAGSGMMMTRRRYPLPRMMAGGLAFRPKEGAAPLVADFSADAVKALADAIAKPGKDDGDGAAVTIGFAVDGGAVVAAMIDAGGVSVTVKANPESRWQTAPLDDAPRLPWFVADGDGLAAAIEGLKASDDLKRQAFKVEWRIQDDGNWLAIAGAGGASSVIEGFAVEGFADAEPVELPAIMARAVKGGGRVKVYQLAGDMAGRGFLHIERADGVSLYVAGFAEQPAERFSRVYSAAYQARDRAGMVAAVAVYRARTARPGYARHGSGRAGDDVALLASVLRGMKTSRAALAKAGGMKGADDPGTFARDPKRYAWQGDNSFTHRVATLAERIEAARAAEARRLEYEAGQAAAAIEHAANEARGYHIRKAYGRRGPNGKMVVTPAAVDGDWHQRASRLAYSCGGQFEGRAGGYVMTAPQAERFESLFAAGFDGAQGCRTVRHPDGLPVPKVTRAKRAAQTPQDAPGDESATLTPEAPVALASGPESAAVAAIEPEPAADDLAEAAEGFNCQGRGRPEAECSAAPCPDVLDDRSEGGGLDDGEPSPAPDLAATVAELLARVAALESAKPVESPVAAVADAPPEYWAARLREAEAAARDWRADAIGRPSVKERDDLRAALAEAKAGDADERRRLRSLIDEARADLAAMTAERDALAAQLEQAAEWSAFTRRRTAERLRAVRATARELEGMNHGMASTLAKARAETGEALKARLADQARIEALERDVARARIATGGLPGIRYVAGHIGTMRPAEPITAPVGARRAA